LFLVVVLSVKVLVNNPPPPGYSLDNMPRVGLDADYNFAPSVLNAASSSGAKVIRAHMSWTTLEPQNTDPSHYTWATYDSIFSRIASAGLSPILVIDKCPAWACPFMRGPVNAANMNDYSEMVNAVVTRYSQPPYSVRFWELLDEPDGAAGPNGQWGYANHPAEYVQALAVLHTAVKGLNPEAVVLNGGIAYDYPTGFRREFVGEMLAAGGGRYIDALNFHYFRINGPGWATIGQKAAELRGIMRTAGVDLPLVCTSTGESSENIAPWNSTEAQQARYVVKVNAQAAAAGIRSTVWYLTQDFDCPAGACPSGWEVWARHGLIRQNATPKMAHAAMTTFNTEIGSGAFQRQLGAESGVTGSLEGYHFGGSAEGRPQVWVVWNNAATPGTLIIPAALVAGLQRAVGMSGQLVATSPGTGGAVLVVVGPDPIYLEWRGSRFVDVPQGSTYYTYIEALAQMGATSGYLDGTYRPDANAMRGHISKVIVLAQGWAIDTTNGPHFTDVPPLSAFYQYVETAYNHGIISGYSDGTFRPYNTVTRGQLCKIISIARGWDLVSPPTPTFRDVPSGNAFYTYIETAFSHNIISGYSDGTFRWGSNSTRGQVAKIVYNAVR
jgi:hypothetical protein